MTGDEGGIDMAPPEIVDIKHPLLLGLFWCALLLAYRACQLFSYPVSASYVAGLVVGSQDASY